MSNDNHYGASILGSSQKSFQVAKVLQKLNVPIVSVYSKSYDEAEGMVEALGLKGVTSVYDNINNMWERDDSSWVFVGMPINDHGEMIVDSLYHGRHVLVSNMFAKNIRELSLVCNAMKENKKILMDANPVLNSKLLNHLNCYNFDNTAVAKDIGKVFSVSINFGKGILRSMDSVPYNNTKLLYDPNRDYTHLAIGAAVALCGSRLHFAGAVNNTHRNLSFVEGSCVLNNEFEQRISVNISNYNVLPNSIILGGEYGYVKIKNFLYTLEVEIIDIYGNRKVYSYEDEVRRQYVLPKELYPSYEDVQVAATVLDFINAFNYDFDYVYDNDLNHFRSSLATERLLAQMLNND